MNKLQKEKRIAVVIMVAGLVIIGYYLAKWLMNKDKSLESGSEETPNEPITVTASDFPFGYGSRGEKVACLQRFLNIINNQWSKTSAGWAYVQNRNLPTLVVDGIWGDKTEAVFKGIFSHKTNCDKALWDNYNIGKY